MDSPASVTEIIPRTHLEKFDLYDAHLGEDEGHRFIAAVAKEPPKVIASRALMQAVQKFERKPVVICLEVTDPGLRGAYHKEGIPFASEDGNAYLPFLGIQQKPTQVLRAPAPLSPQAQGIALNLVADRWEDRTASEPAELCGRSRASATKYLRELEAIRPRSFAPRGETVPW